MKKYLVVFLFVGMQLLNLQSAQAAGDKSWNVRTRPLSLALGMINAQVDYAISDNLTVGPDFTSWNLTIGDYDVSASGFGVGANYYFDNVFNDSWYVSGGYSSASATVKYKSSLYGNLEASAQVAGVAIGGGYHWFWESFNLNLGLNTLLAATTKVELKDSTGTVRDTYTYPGGVGLDFAIGFAF